MTKEEKGTSGKIVGIDIRWSNAKDGLMRCVFCEKEKENCLCDTYAKSKLELAKRNRPAEDQELLWEYSRWLQKTGYTDSDCCCEEPYAVDRFLEEREKLIYNI